MVKLLNGTIDFVNVNCNQQQKKEPNKRLSQAWLEWLLIICRIFGPKWLTNYVNQQSKLLIKWTWLMIKKKCCKTWRFNLIGIHRDWDSLWMYHMIYFGSSHHHLVIGFERFCVFQSSFNSLQLKLIIWKRFTKYC